MDQKCDSRRLKPRDRKECHSYHTPDISHRPNSKSQRQPWLPSWLKVWVSHQKAVTLKSERLRDFSKGKSNTQLSYSRQWLRQTCFESLVFLNTVHRLLLLACVPFCICKFMFISNAIPQNIIILAFFPLVRENVVKYKFSTTNVLNGKKKAILHYSKNLLRSTRCKRKVYFTFIQV